MTNGEKLCIDFPDMHYTLSEKQTRRVVTTIGVCASFDLDWWNAEYKEPTTKNDVPGNNVGKIDPTTKNDLGVDAVSRQEVLDLIADYDLSMGQVVRGIHALPSVTPQLSSELEKNSKKLAKDFGELDCISRADAIRVASGYCHPSNVAKELVKLPSVTPQERKTGKWISTETKGVRYAFWCRYKCSLCGGLSDHTNFCPNCGAKMESEDKEQEDDNT